MEEDESMNEASEMLEKDSTENRFATSKIQITILIADLLY